MSVRRERTTFVKGRWIVGMLAFVCAPAVAAAQQIAALTPAVQPVGTTAVFAVSGATTETHQFRFSVRAPGEPFRILRDFSEWRAFEWTPLEDGVYDVKLTVRQGALGEISESSVRYEASPRVLTQPVVTASAHPLVALYSAPSCGSGSLRVRYRPASGGSWQYTSWKSCSARSTNLWVAGMVAEMTYLIQQEVAASGMTRGPLLPFTTGAVASYIPRITVPLAPTSRTSFADGVVLHSLQSLWPFVHPMPVATDLAGRVVWYYGRLQNQHHFGSIGVRPVEGGTMLLTVSAGRVGQLLREIDLAGNTVRETSVATVRQQLDDLGLIDSSRYYAGAFHHDAYRLANGHTLVLMSLEQMIGDVDYLGDAVVDLDENLQVTWAFNSFEKLPSPLDRPPTLNEACVSPQVDGCEPLSLAPWAVDWTHTNTISYVREDGNLLLSMRNQDRVLKIDYRNGQGTGDVVWTFGYTGDFTLIDPSGDPMPWFSHQHDVNMNGDELVVYDNGNVRRIVNPAAVSRGQVYRIDEEARTATLVVNVSLGDYSGAFGSAQKLTNGNYQFGSGFLPGMRALSTEVTPTGTVTYVNQVENAFAYRSWRLLNLYGRQ